MLLKVFLWVYSLFEGGFVMLIAAVRQGFFSFAYDAAISCMCESEWPWYASPLYRLSTLFQKSGVADASLRCHVRMILQMQKCKKIKYLIHNQFIIQSQSRRTQEIQEIRTARYCDWLTGARDKSVILWQVSVMGDRLDTLPSS